jgi:hypothetical protein
MTTLAKLPLVILLSGLIAMSATSCAPSIQELNLSQELVDNLPQDQALAFLQTLRPSPLGYVHCRFDQDGVGRWIPRQRQTLPGKKPYPALVARPERPGVMIVIVLYQGRHPWCIIPAESNADARGREDYKKFAGKIITALLSLGVTARSYDRKVMRARSPSSG